MSSADNFNILLFLRLQYNVFFGGNHHTSFLLQVAGPNEKISMFRVECLKILGRFAHIFKKILEKNIILCILKGISTKMHKIIFFPENLKNILGFTGQ